MTNKFSIEPEPHEVNYSEGKLNIDDCDTTVNIAIGWKVGKKIASDYLNKLDDKEFENFIKEIEEERNE